MDDGDARSRHWNESAKTLLTGIILLTLTFEENERHLITVRELLTLTYPPLVRYMRAKSQEVKAAARDEKFFDENRLGVDTLLQAMAGKQGHVWRHPGGDRQPLFGNAAYGARQHFLNRRDQHGLSRQPSVRRISRRSDFKLVALRSDRPTTIYLCLPVGRLQSHFRWLRLIVQMACTVLEQLGTYPRDRPPILFMMEEFATLGHMEIMERAAAYFPGFGVKLWAILQDTTQLQRYYQNSWETFLGNAGLVQCFANVTRRH